MLPVSQLRLDLENPRLYTRKIAGNTILSQEDLEYEIIGESGSAEYSAFTLLLNAIKLRGVEDPIWVKKENGHYVVIEGNRRTPVRRKLIADEIEPPEGVSFDTVIAHVVDDSVSDVEIKLQKARLQSGKKAWGAVNDAAVVHEFHNDLHMAIEDIAAEMQYSKAKVNKLLKSFNMWLKYAQKTGDPNEKRFAYFNEAPVKVISWVDESARNQENYYEWITPVNGKAKIRSVASGRGSLREFAKCLDDNEAIELLREDPQASVEDAYEIVKSNDVLKDMTFLKRILLIAKSLNEMDEIQLSKLANERRYVVHLQSLKTACEAILRDLENIE